MKALLLNDTTAWYHYVCKANSLVLKRDNTLLDRSEFVNTKWQNISYYNKRSLV